jgi:plasmid stabilization system protein ParE
MAELRICSLAESEFTDALCWYAERSETIARRFDDEFSQALVVIVNDPERFPRMDSRHRFYLMRSFPYQILYRSVGNIVTVIAVAHTARQPTYWAGR